MSIYIAVETQKELLTAFNEIEEVIMNLKSNSEVGEYSNEERLNKALNIISNLIDEDVFQSE